MRCSLGVLTEPDFRASEYCAQDVFDQVVFDWLTKAALVYDPFRERAMVLRQSCPTASGPRAFNRSSSFKRW
jgi:hypothetical protein